MTTNSNNQPSIYGTAAHAVLKDLPKGGLNYRDLAEKCRDAILQAFKDAGKDEPRDVASSLRRFVAGSKDFVRVGEGVYDLASNWPEGAPLDGNKQAAVSHSNKAVSGSDAPTKGIYGRTAERVLTDAGGELTYQEIAKRGMAEIKAAFAKEGKPEPKDIADALRRAISSDVRFARTGIGIYDLCSQAGTETTAVVRDAPNSNGGDEPAGKVKYVEPKIDAPKNTIEYVNEVIKGVAARLKAGTIGSPLVYPDASLGSIVVNYLVNKEPVTEILVHDASGFSEEAGARVAAEAERSILRNAGMEPPKKEGVDAVLGLESDGSADDNDDVSGSDDSGNDSGNGGNDGNDGSDGGSGGSLELFEARCREIFYEANAKYAENTGALPNMLYIDDSDFVCLSYDAFEPADLTTAVSASGFTLDATNDIIEDVNAEFKPRALRLLTAKQDFAADEFAIARNKAENLHVSVDIIIDLRLKGLDWDEIDEDAIDAFVPASYSRDDLKSKLETGFWDIAFVKANEGVVRRMTATLDMGLVPASDHPKGTGGPQNLSVLPVWSRDDAGWRSFRIASLVSIAPNQDANSTDDMNDVNDDDINDASAE